MPHQIETIAFHGSTPWHRLGDSEREARHWLVTDALAGDLYAAPRGEASFVVRTQRLPPPAGTA